MLDTLKDLFKEGLEYTHTAGLLQQLANVLNIVNVQYMKDGDAKNTAIDLICQLLQSHKEAPAVPAEPSQEPADAAS
jgi:hypothetical protein